LDTKHWLLKWKEEALEDLERIDQKDSKLIKYKIETYLLQDPLSIGKTLQYNMKGIYSYRVGLYRVLYTVNQTEVFILIIKINKRDKVYS
jgi:mRNA interferase RelE/StbE